MSSADRRRRSVTLWGGNWNPSGVFAKETQAMTMLRRAIEFVARTEIVVALTVILVSLAAWLLLT
jgi:hypothetical protein